jgi:hypothetical protein
MVLAFAGDSTMTSRPRPAVDVRGAVAVRFVLLAVFVAARRGVADVCSGIARLVLHVVRAVVVKCGVQDVEDIGTGQYSRQRVLAVST